MMFSPEMLESRRMLSASVKFDAASGLLSVEGGRGNDAIRVTVNPDAREDSSVGIPALSSKRSTLVKRSTSDGIATPTVARRPGLLLPGVSVFDNGTLIFNSATQRAEVTQVDVNGLTGNDSIDLLLTQAKVAVRADGGDGDDTLFLGANNSRAAELAGGAGNDYIQLQIVSSGGNIVDAGDGDDTVIADTLSGPVGNGRINGGAGDDTMKLNVSREVIDDVAARRNGYTASGGADNDVIQGSALNDSLFGDSGRDDISAGDGDDFVAGGTESDILRGERGNDLLDHGGGTDVLDGGLGFDSAFSGKEDTRISIEVILTGDAISL